VKLSLGRLCIALPLAAFALVLADHVGSTPLHRSALWQVVRTCTLAAQTVGMPFPCEQVTLASDDAPGSAIIKSPLHKSEFLLMPLEAAAGVESPAVRGGDSSALWQRAWETRSMVQARLGRELPRTAVALVVNSGIARSQDQFHIHIDCVAPSVERKLALYGPKEESSWQLFPQALMGQRYWVKAVDKPELDTTNVIGLIAAGLPKARSAMYRVNVVVVGAELADGRPGFYILANWDKVAAERLMDHSCAIG
jgi:CDP-diacylglycerol pyrophosphatase